ncbi:MAG: cellulase family glycosylhydrolase [Bacteroidales bacterium]|nr:cellulase family glycosylhydrolase [Bacteroidales bacterium]
MNRRMFVRSTALTAAGLTLSGKNAFSAGIKPAKNKLPKWKGFNLLDIFSPNPPRSPNSSKTTEEDIKWMADWGFDFVRIPMAYPRYVVFDRTRDITKDEVYKFDEKVLEEVDNIIFTAHKYKMHVSLNLHRGPGFCINAGFHEPFNLWKDKEAQDAFNFHWSMWAKRYKGISSDKLSFDLLNEPTYREDMNDQYSKSHPLPGELYRKVAKGASDAIRAVDPGRLIVADGNGGGSLVTPELIDLDLAQSCRGYYPHYISHYQASWVWKDPSAAPNPVWPGVIDGKQFGRQTLEDFYKPWIELLGKGVGVHCGECGCYSKTPHEVFLAWFTDVIDILTSQGIGFALWNFRGAFGIMDSERTDIRYTDWYGHKLDSKLLDLIRKY